MHTYEPASAAKLVAQAYADCLLRDLAIINERVRLEPGPTTPRPAIDEPNPGSSARYQAGKSPVPAQPTLGTEDVNRQQLASIAIAVGLTACGQSSMAPLPDQPKTGGNTPLASESLGDKLKEGMSYSQFRGIVLAGGWKPVVDPECKAQVVGGDYVKRCEAGGAMCEVCDALPELSACGAGGLCMSVFEGPSGQRLNVTGIGDVTSWNKPNGKSEFYAQTWYFEPTN